MDSTNPMQGKPTFTGTVAPAKVKRSRAANKVARKSRRANRRAK